MRYREPCNGTCHNPDYIFCDGKCNYKKYYWDCNGKCQYVEKPCNGVCHNPNKIACKGECFYKGNTWDCDGECKDIREPCNGVCHNPNYIVCDGSCNSKNLYWDCNGNCQYVEKPCNGVCFDPDETFCVEKCISKNKTRDCNGECQNVRETCKGACHNPNDTFCNGGCYSKVHYWDCNSECLDLDEPCNEVCQHTRQKCGKECINLSKDKRWECNGECQSHYESCNGVCPIVGNVSHIQESYLKCPQNERCFLLSEMCDISLNKADNEKNCFEKVNLSDKLCNRFPSFSSTFSCPNQNKQMCKQSTQCIQDNNICNGVIDCFDRSDESMCPENLSTELDFTIFKYCQITPQNYRLPSVELGFKCGLGCLPYTDWCRGIDTKLAAKSMSLNISDCPILLKTLNNEKLCQNFTFWRNRPCQLFYKRFAGNYPGQCIRENGNFYDNEFKNKYWQSDGLQRKCTDNRTSIPEEFWCDGYMQCADKSDEDPEECEKCPRTYGFPKDNKHATFSCKHKYTGRPICAVPCDGKDDLCLDDIDEQCSTASLKSTLFFGTALVIFSVISGELYIFCVKKSKSNKNKRFQLKMLKENNLMSILECCSDGHATLNKTLANFKKSHCTEQHARDCVIVSHTLGLIDGEKAQDVAKLFYNFECKYHRGNFESVHICIKKTFETNENTKLLFALISQPPVKTQFLKKSKSVLNVFKTQYIAGVFFLLLVSAKLFAYYTDVYKDIYIIVEYSKLLPVDNLNLNSFGLQVFITLIVSVTLPMIVNLFILHLPNEKKILQSRMIHFGIIILSPLVPALAVYVSSKLHFVSQRIKKFHQNNKKLKSHNSLESIKTLIENNHLMQQTSALLSDLRSNENATEHFIQSLVLILLIALKFTKTGTVSGFQELLVGNSDFYLLVLSAIWSVVSIISGFVQRKIVQKNHSMPFSGNVIHLIFAAMAMICRISSFVFFFAPAMGLFNLLGHWKMGNFKFDSGEMNTVLIYDVTYNGTFIKAKDVWKQINKYEDLTLFQLDVYYIVFLIIILCHFLLVAAIKITCSKEFKSRKDYFKKMLHIFHQGNSNAFSA
jgi:hypothetical protein